MIATGGHRVEQVDQLYFYELLTGISPTINPAKKLNIVSVPVLSRLAKVIFYVNHFAILTPIIIVNIIVFVGADDGNDPECSDIHSIITLKVLRISKISIFQFVIDKFSIFIPR